MKNLDNFACYWIARNIRSIKDVRSHNGTSIYAFFPIISMKYLLNTDLLVTSDTLLESLFFYNRPKIIQLWHAVTTKSMSPHKNNLDAWYVSSEYIKQRYEKVYNLPEKKIHVTGYPGLDILYKHLKNDSIRVKFCNKYNIKNKILLYAPTWDCGLWGWGDQYNQFEKLCSYCIEHNITLILRLHPLSKINKRKLRKIVNKYDVLWLDMDKEPDTMKLLAVSDIFITDWSSVCVDFLLTKRPIIHLDINKEYFTKRKGEPEVPPKFRSGEIVIKNDDFFKTLDIVLTKGNRFEKKQEESLKVLHGNADGKSSERVSKKIEQLLKIN